MKNPFQKEDHTGLYIGLAFGAAAGIGLAYLFLTEKGKACRKDMSRRFKELVSDEAATFIDQKTIVPKKAAKLATDVIIKD